MKKQPKKFTTGDNKSFPIETLDDGYPKSPSKNRNLGLVMIIAILLVVIGSIAISSGMRQYKYWSQDWDVVMFAKENPDVVRAVKGKYETGVQQVKADLLSPKE